jgi:hypothetical protein
MESDFYTTQEQRLNLEKGLVDILNPRYGGEAARSGCYDCEVPHEEREDGKSDLAG